MSFHNITDKTIQICEFGSTGDKYEIKIGFKNTEKKVHYCLAYLKLYLLIQQRYKIKFILNYTFSK